MSEYNPAKRTRISQRAIGVRMASSHDVTLFGRVAELVRAAGVLTHLGGSLLNIAKPPSAVECFRNIVLAVWLLAHASRSSLGESVGHDGRFHK